MDHGIQIRLGPPVDATAAKRKTWSELLNETEGATEDYKRFKLPDITHVGVQTR